MDERQEFEIEAGVLTRYSGPGGEVAVPEGVEAIQHSVFDACAGLTGVTLPESLRTIGFHAFMECPKLTEITIPQNVCKIGPWAFFSCKGLRKITLLSTNMAPVSKENDPFDEVDAPIAAPNLPLKNMPACWKPRAAWGFALEWEQYPQARQEEYLSYIRSQRKRLCPLAVRRQELLLLMLGEEMFSRKEMEMLLEEADRQNSAAVRSMILDYQA